MCITEGLINQVTCIDETCAKTLSAPPIPLSKEDFDLLPCILFHSPPLPHELTDSPQPILSPPINITIHFPLHSRKNIPIHPPSKTKILRTYNNDNLLSPRTMSTTHHPASRRTRHRVSPMFLPVLLLLSGELAWTGHRVSITAGSH